LGCAYQINACRAELPLLLRNGREYESLTP
jgi:hypothetical protein